MEELDFGRSTSTNTSPNATRTPSGRTVTRTLEITSSSRSSSGPAQPAEGEKTSSAAWALLRSDLMDSRKQLTELTIEAERLRAENARLRDAGASGLERRFREETARYEAQLDELREALRAAESRGRALESDRELLERKLYTIREECAAQQGSVVERMAVEHVAAQQRAEEEAACAPRPRPPRPGGTPLMAAQAAAAGGERAAGAADEAALLRAELDELRRVIQEGGASERGLLAVMRAYLLSRGLLAEDDPRLGSVGGAAAAIAAASYGAAPPAADWDEGAEEGNGFGGTARSGGGFPAPGDGAGAPRELLPWTDGQQPAAPGGARPRSSAPGPDKAKQPAGTASSRSRIGFVRGTPGTPRTPGLGGGGAGAAGVSCASCGISAASARKFDDVASEMQRLREQMNALMLERAEIATERSEMERRRGEVEALAAEARRQAAEGASLEAELERARKEAECREKLRHSRELERVKAETERERAAMAARLAALESLLRDREPALSGAPSTGLATPGRR
eukprot:tig00020685_g12939.t1